MLLIFVLGTIVMSSIYLLRAYRNNAVNWRFGIGVGIFTLALFLFDRLNGLTGFYKGYNTSQALITFLGMQAIGILLGAAMIGFIAALVASLADTLYKEDLAEEMPLMGWLDVLRLKAGSGVLWLQAFVVAVCFSLFDKGMDVLSGHVRYTTLLPYLDTKIRAPGGVNSYFPFLDALLNTATGIVIAVIAYIIVLLIWRRVVGRMKTFVILVGLAVILMRAIGPADDFYHFSVLLALAVLHVSVSGFMILRVIRYNLVVYMCLIWLRIIYESEGFLKADISFYQLNGVLMLVFGLLPLVMAFLAWRKTST